MRWKSDSRQSPAARLGALLVALCLLSGCAPIQAPDTIAAWASFYPVYALAAGVCEGVPGVSLRCLVQPQDGCLRSYSLSDWDAALLAGGDLCILGGRGLASFESAVSRGDAAVLTVLDNIPLVDLGETDGEEDPSGHFSGPNPWLFLSVSGARSMAAVIAAGLAELDPDYAHLYARNLAAFDARLEALGEEMRAAVAGLPRPRAALLQEGLCYFAEEMGLQWAIVPREAGAEYLDNDLAELLDRLAAAGCELVLVEKQAPPSLTDALAAAGYAVCRVDILSTHAGAEGPDGYFSAMRANAGALAEALRGM